MSRRSARTCRGLPRPFGALPEGLCVPAAQLRCPGPTPVPVLAPTCPLLSAQRLSPFLKSSPADLRKRDGILRNGDKLRFNVAVEGAPNRHRELLALGTGEKNVPLARAFVPFIHISYFGWISTFRRIRIMRKLRGVMRLRDTQRALTTLGARYGSAHMYKVYGVRRPWPVAERESPANGSETSNNKLVHCCRSSDSRGDICPAVCVSGWGSTMRHRGRTLLQGLLAVFAALIAIGVTPAFAAEPPAPARSSRQMAMGPTR